MQLILTDEQYALQQSAQALFRARAPVARLRGLRDARSSEDACGFSRALWREMAELGWVGLCLPEAHGGLGLGLRELCVVLEQAGRELAPEPFVSSVLLGAQALLLGGSHAQQSEWLPRVASGDALLALAYEETGSRGELGRIETRAVRSGGTLRLYGEKPQVLDAHVADALIVLARVDAGRSLFVVKRDQAGMSMERQTRIDGRNAARVRFDGVELTAAALVGEGGNALPLLSRVLDRALVGVAAEMLGSASRAFEDTLDYLKTRKQFGVPIGSFQALAHRAARLYVELALARSAVLAAASCADGGPDEALPRLASLAKARCSDAFVHVANEAVQMHGGIGVTDDFHIGFYLKRARAADVLLGDATHHLRRWAALSGY